MKKIKDIDEYFYKEEIGFVFPCVSGFRIRLSLIMCQKMLPMYERIDKFLECPFRCLEKPSCKICGKKQTRSALGLHPHPPPKRVKAEIAVWKMRVNCDKCGFATRQRMSGVLVIVEIHNYGGLPIADPAHKATLFVSMLGKPTSPKMDEFS